MGFQPSYFNLKIFVAPVGSVISRVVTSGKILVAAIPVISQDWVMLMEHPVPEYPESPPATLSGKLFLLWNHKLTYLYPLLSILFLAGEAEKKVAVLDGGVH